MRNYRLPPVGLVDLYYEYRTAGWRTQDALFASCNEYDSKYSIEALRKMLGSYLGSRKRKAANGAVKLTLFDKEVK